MLRSLRELLENAAAFWARNCRGRRGSWMGVWRAPSRDGDLAIGRNPGFPRSGRQAPVARLLLIHVGRPLEEVVDGKENVGLRLVAKGYQSPDLRDVLDHPTFRFPPWVLWENGIFGSGTLRISPSSLTAFLAGFIPTQLRNGARKALTVSGNCVRRRVVLMVRRRPS